MTYIAEHHKKEISIKPGEDCFLRRSSKKTTKIASPDKNDDKENSNFNEKKK